MAEGSVYFRKSDGRWAAEWVDRRGKRRTLYRRTQVEARRALRAKLRERDEGAGGEDPKLSAWAAWWLDQLDKRPTTVADYRYKLGLLPDWLTVKRLSRIDVFDVHEALAELSAGVNANGKPRASSTVAQVRTVLGSCLHTAQQYGHVTRNVARLAKAPEVTQTEIVPLTLAEATALLAHVKGHRLESLYRVALSLGLRQGECLGLQWGDVDLDAGTLEVRRQITRTNTGQRVEGDVKSRRSRRSLTLPRVCAEQLRAHKVDQARERLHAYEWADHGLVWPSTRGTPMSPRNLLRHLYGACDGAEVRRVSFHALRHSAATFLLAQGVPDRVIIDVLGHSDSRQLTRYAHVTDSLRQEAADAMDRNFGQASTVIAPVKATAPDANPGP